MTNDLEIHIIELPKAKEEKEDSKEFGWIEFIKKGDFDMGKNYDKELLEAKEELAKLQADKETRNAYFDREMALMDFINGIEGSREEGFAEGLTKGKEEGEEKGRKETKKEIIINMYNQKIDIDTISKIVNLSKNEVEKIIQAIE